ncbi:hypothetical protein CEUSTIGMA_g3040.t1 [Chlamydomonas eustigma]|uniref:Uncharacterized protein n=1 Tax=Chlamydomonas eustigma TaxID=1157962 RepID=A0A250WXU0_9CHLO|nr:hypothetical protein CEUSTIGMA_g3040.t1 [Chlamydomonas eustigma]|eukprot:GAX75596.1 hypothetical protein CEUSTIGMA_g3040.t1 [Chlamydomonas eustigma]
MSGGRPFLHNGHIHRWALEQHQNNPCPNNLHLLRIDVLTEHDYWETLVQTRNQDHSAVTDPSASHVVSGHVYNDSSTLSSTEEVPCGVNFWSHLNVQHVDIQQQVVGGSTSSNSSRSQGLIGILELDPHRQSCSHEGRHPGTLGSQHTHVRHVGHSLLLQLAVAAVVLQAFCLLAGCIICHPASKRSLRTAAFSVRLALQPVCMCFQHAFVSLFSRPQREIRHSTPVALWHGPSSLHIEFPIKDSNEDDSHNAIDMNKHSTRRMLVEAVMLFWMLAAFASLSIFVVFVSAPTAIPCSRWNVHVAMSLSPPAATHQHPAAPYDVSDLVVVTGATAGFFDRISNMVGSLQYWEPLQPVIVFDLGFNKAQLQQIACWKNVELRRFPFEKFPPHVHDVTNYAFKALALVEVINERSSTVLWIDSGLELRAPMSRLRHVLSHQGHVSALQEDLIGDPMYTMTFPMVQWFGLSERWEPEVRHWQFCAGGLQGFVRGSMAEYMVLRRVANCSLHAHECMAPPGSSRDNHNFDQTAFTIAIWAANLTCLPRETHMMWSVKKASWDPTQLSAPIEIVSRGHRLPKPYKPISQEVMQDLCQEHAQGILKNVDETPIMVLRESTSRHGLWFKITRVYLQPVADVTVMALSCDGFHTTVAEFLVMLICMTVALSLVNRTRAVKLWGVRAIHCVKCSNTGIITMFSVTIFCFGNFVFLQGISFFLSSHVR